MKYLIHSCYLPHLLDNNDNNILFYYSTYVPYGICYTEYTACYVITISVFLQAKAANKMVFFLIEDAVATGTLASKLVRQATKWNGHEAFVLLRNGYVFNGPQTATILLAEISKIRLLRDEDASSFCLRLVELIEDLELVPGDAAVFLTDTQKLG
jgi:hypothetical protein